MSDDLAYTRVVCPDCATHFMIVWNLDSLSHEIQDEPEYCPFCGTPMKYTKAKDQDDNNY